MTRAETADARPRAGRLSAASQQMDALVGYVLMGGVILSMLLVAAGLLWHWVISGEPMLEYSVSGMNFFQFLVADVQRFLLTGPGPRRLVSLGIATLMLTPYVRVLASMLYFAIVEHNWKYTAFTAFVFSVLSFSLFLR